MDLTGAPRNWNIYVSFNRKSGIPHCAGKLSDAMKKIIIRISAVLILLVVVALVVVFFSLNSIVKKAVETVGPKMTKVEVRLGAADISPFSGSGKLSKLFVGNPEGYKTPYAIQMDSIKVSVQIGSVTKDTIVVNEINVQSPEISFDGGLSGNNLSKILDNLKSASADSTSGKSNTVATPTGPKKEKKIMVKDFVVQGAKIHLNITGLGVPISTTAPIPDIHLQNVGTAEGGLTPEQLGEQLMKPVYSAALTLAEGTASSAVKGITDLGKGAVGQVTNVTSKLTNVTDSLGGLFKKK